MMQGVAAVERALTILEAFRRGEDTLTLAQLAQRTGYYKSTILRLAVTLQATGYLERTVAGTYTLGAAPLRLAAISQRTHHPSDVIMPVLHELVQRTDESASYTVRRGATAMCVYRVDSPHMVRDTLRPGDAYPIDTAASGKAIRAFEAPHLEAHARVRTDLIARSDAALTPDYVSVATPIFGADGAVRGSISLSGLAHRFAESAMPGFVRLLLTSAGKITAEIGGDASVYAAAAARLVPS